MALQEEIHAKLCTIADEIWNSTDHDDGFALLAEPVDILDFVEGLPSDVDDNDDAHDGEWPPWGLEHDVLIGMAWDWGLPFSHRADITVVALPSGRRLYVLNIEEVCTQIVSVTSVNWTSRTDLTFLQRILRDNGASFGTQLIIGAPHYISTSIGSTDLLVDAFVSLFTAAGQHCWTELHNYIVDAGDAGQPTRVTAVAAYLHDALESRARLVERTD